MNQFHHIQAHRIYLRIQYYSVIYLANALVRLLVCFYNHSNHNSLKHVTSLDQIHLFLL